MPNKRELFKWVNICNGTVNHKVYSNIYFKKGVRNNAQLNPKFIETEHTILYAK